VAALAIAPSAFAAPPPNDDFANAQTLTGPTATTSGTNIAATVEPGEPWHAGVPASSSVWYRLATPGPGQISLNTCDADFNSVLAVYTGSSVGFLGPVASNDNSSACPNGVGSSVSFHQGFATTFSIAVDGYGGAQGSFQLRVDFLRDVGYALLDALKVHHRKGTVTARFSGSEPGMRFVCTLDGARRKACTSPFTFGNRKTWGRLKKGIHRFDVAAFDSLGRSANHPTARGFKIK
jgi:hypothetical protein